MDFVRKMTMGDSSAFAMVGLEEVYPGYGFAAHKGYPTKQHIEALKRLGVTLIHRRSFAPVKDLI